jgi:hypothetical protein
MGRLQALPATRHLALELDFPILRLLIAINDNKEAGLLPGFFINGRSLIIAALSLF